MKDNKGEITLRDLIVKTKEYFMLIPRNWKYIALISVISMIMLTTEALFQKPIYKADLSFMINEDSGNPLGSISGMLGTFGIENKGKSNIARVLELSKSRRIIEKVLLDKVLINDTEDFFANHLINYLDTLKEWNYQPGYKFWAKTDDSLQNFKFQHSDLSKFTETDFKALKKLYASIAGNQDGNDGLMHNGFSAESRILNLSVESLEQDLSIQLTNSLFDELSSFYVEKSIEKQKSTFKILKIKTDSLRNILEKRENQLASMEDSWMGRYSNTSKIDQKRLNKEIQFISIALGESIKNLEIADFAVKNTTPYVQIIDRPVIPLDVIKDSWLKQAILGLLLGASLSTVIFFIRKFFQDALSG
mgnify:FL=1|jgi:uncharacterized protein YukE